MLGSGGDDTSQDPSECKKDTLVDTCPPPMVLQKCRKGKGLGYRAHSSSSVPSLPSTCIYHLSVSETK